MIGELRVVGHDEQAGGVLIQSTYGNYPLAEILDEVIYGRPSIGVAVAGM